MIIKSIHVKNYRSILDERVDCDSMTALVGRNGSGKSTFLRAIEIFYDPKAVVSAEDFYAEDTNNEIEIAITFTGLGSKETELFSPYLDGNDLIVAKVFSFLSKKLGTYHGMRLHNIDFALVREADGKKEVISKYKEIQKQSAYSALPSVNKSDDALEALSQWEAANPGNCIKLRDDGQFFGFAGVGTGYLGRHTRFIYIPAVRDASADAIDGKGSCVTEIMDLVVRRALANRNEFINLKEGVQKQYREIMDPAKLTELSVLQAQLAETLRHYAPESDVTMEWMDLVDIDFPLPKALVKLHEDGYKSTVQRTGHGLQRAFILTLLQHLVAAKGSSTLVEEIELDATENLIDKAPQLPSLVLAIEEPELYQHPSRQRHMAAILLKLSQGAIPGVAKNTQVIYTTHSPLFVGLDHFEYIRLLRKITHFNGQPKVTKVVNAELNAVAEELWDANGKQGMKYTAGSLRPRLQAVMTPWMNEGFFADVVVLVEGEDDRAALLGMAQSMGHDLDSLGVTVIPCFGKSNLDRPLVIFRKLGIPVYVVWDGDYKPKDAKPERNKYLLKILGEPEQDWPDYVGDVCAIFKVNLETTLLDQIGSDNFNQWLAEAQNKLGIAKKDHALKNPAVLRSIVESASADGRMSSTMKGIVERIIALKPQQHT